MAKKTKKQEQKIPEEALKNLTPETQKKLGEIKKKLDVFKDKVIEKFGEYILGIALLPPSPPPKGKEQTPEQKKLNDQRINVLILVDDSEGGKMSKEELKDKLSAINSDIAQKIDKNLAPQTVLISELWQSCYDAKYELLQLIALSAPVYDTGMLSAVKIGEIHKSMVLKKFERYIVSYVLFGSLTRGDATPESDVDIAIIIDDTDVKKMTRAELKDKLRAIIIGMGLEAGQMTGIKNKLNVQVYILTDFWESVKESNPVIFTLLRDGVPFYDRGMFMPWKQLLRMGRIKPSQEAIDLFMSTGEKMVEKVKFKLRGLIESDIFWSTITPAQAAIMLYGLPPPSREETVKLLDEIFVKKEKMFDKKHVETLEAIRKYYKDLEHGRIKETTGKEVDSLLKRADEFLKALKKLFEDIQKRKEKESVVHTWETVVTILRDALRLEGVDKVKDSEIVGRFEDTLVAKGKVPERFLRVLKDLVKAKKDYDAGKLTKPEIENVRKKAREFTAFLIEYIQRKRGRDLDRAKIMVKYGERYGEVLLLGKEVFIVHDIDKAEKEVSKAGLKEDGSLSAVKKTTMEDFEKALTKVGIPPKVFLKEKLFEDLKKIFGAEVEILVNR